MTDLNEIADAVHQNAVDHGFHPADSETEDQWLANQLLNLHEEVTELSMARRAGTLDDPCDKAEKMRELGLEPLTCREEEYADLIIRGLDQMRRQGINPLRVVLTKHAFNKIRPYKHGKKN